MSSETILLHNQSAATPQSIPIFKKKLSVALFLLLHILLCIEANKVEWVLV